MKTTWIDREIDESRSHPDFAIEKLVLHLVGEIHLRMRELGISQEELAKRMGMSQPSVSKALRYSNNVTVKTLARIACALECEWQGIRLEPVRVARRNGAATPRKKARTNGAHAPAKSAMTRAVAVSKRAVRPASKVASARSRSTKR